MEKSYTLTMCILMVHQIDAAFWQEWEMFFLPGGIQGFLIFNILIIPVVLFGYKQVLLKTSKSTKYSYFCAGLGLFTFTIHTVFYLLGNNQFTLPLSALLIILCLPAAIWQIVQTRGQAHAEQAV